MMKPNSRRRSYLLSLALLPAATLACGSKDASSESAAAAAAMADGPANCQRFSEAYTACIAEMPEAGRPNAKEGLKQMQDAWKKVDKEAMDGLCKQALDAARQGVGPVCPNVKWQ